jgi:hypothetical protein
MPRAPLGESASGLKPLFDENPRYALAVRVVAREDEARDETRDGAGWIQARPDLLLSDGGRGRVERRLLLRDAAQQLFGQHAALRGRCLGDHRLGPPQRLARLIVLAVLLRFNAFIDEPRRGEGAFGGGGALLNRRLNPLPRPHDRVIVGRLRLHRLPGEQARHKNCGEHQAAK